MSSQSDRVYLAGPMTWIPKFNFPEFDAAAAHLRLLGWQVQSPAEMDDPEVRAAALASPDGAPGSASPNGETWGDFLARDVKLLADTDLTGIVFLPNAFKSRGVKLEATVGLLCGLKFWTYSNAGPVQRDREWVKQQLNAHL